MSDSGQYSCQQRRPYHLRLLGQVLVALLPRE